MALPDGQVAATASYLTIKGQAIFVFIALYREQPRRRKRVVEGRIVPLREWVYVLAKRPYEEFRLTNTAIEVPNRRTMKQCDGRTTCGIIVILVRSASRLSELMSSPE